MRTTKVYRADDYSHNMGDIIGFFATKEEAENEITYARSTNIGDGDFSQITEFEIPSHHLNGIELSDTQTMLSDAIWGAGELINEYYFN